MNPPRNRAAKRLAGFTLLESSVALAIFAAAGMALYGLFAVPPSRTHATSGSKVRSP